MSERNVSTPARVSASRLLLEADRERHGTVAAAERELHGTLTDARRDAYQPKKRRDVSAAADALRTLAAIQEEVQTVETLGGMTGHRALAASIYTHLRGCDAEQTRDLADLVEALA